MSRRLPKMRVNAGELGVEPAEERVEVRQANVSHCGRVQVAEVELKYQTFLTGREAVL
jgi:hypothetical protein